MEPINLDDLPTELPHDPIPFQDSGAMICLHCGGQVNQVTRKGRCVAREQYSDCCNPFVSHDGPTRWRPGGWGPDGS